MDTIPYQLPVTERKLNLLSYFASLHACQFGSDYLNFWNFPVYRFYYSRTWSNANIVNIVKTPCYSITQQKLLTLSAPHILEICSKNLNFYFHTSLWCLKRFYVLCTMYLCTINLVSRDL